MQVYFPWGLNCYIYVCLLHILLLQIKHERSLADYCLLCIQHLHMLCIFPYAWNNQSPCFLDVYPPHLPCCKKWMRILLDFYYLKHSSVIWEFKQKWVSIFVLDISFHNLFGDLRSETKWEKVSCFWTNEHWQQN